MENQKPINDIRPIRIQDLSIPLQICAYTNLLQAAIYFIIIILYIIITVATITTT